MFTVAIATAEALSAAIFIGWWSLPFSYIAKMATIEGETCPAFHTQLLTVMTTPSGYSKCTAFCRNCQCEHTYGLKIASVSMEEHELRHSIRLPLALLFIWFGHPATLANHTLRFPNSTFSPYA